MSWVEFDSSHLSNGSYGQSTWPALNTSTSYLSCGSNCIQGQLASRIVVLNTSNLNVNPYSMLEKLQAKRAEFLEYTIKA